MTSHFGCLYPVVAIDYRCGGDPRAFIKSKVGPNDIMGRLYNEQCTAMARAAKDADSDSESDSSRPPKMKPVEKALGAIGRSVARIQMHEGGPGALGQTVFVAIVARPRPNGEVHTDV